MENNKNVFESKPVSYWIDSTKNTYYEPLDSDINVDVAVVGGGMAGITLSYLLKKRGLKVALIEAERIINGASGHTTAKITYQHNLIYDKLIRDFGKEKALQYFKANKYGAGLIEKFIKEMNIECDYLKEPAYVYTQSDNYADKVEDEVKAAKELGIDAKYCKDIPIPIDVKAAVKFENQAQFHPRKYLLALAEKIPGDGSFIFENTRAVDIKEGDVCEVITQNGKKVLASNVVIDTHFPFFDGKGFYFARMYAEKSYAIAVEAEHEFNGGMYINAETPVRSLRSQKCGDEDILIVGGENHKTGQDKHTNTHYENLFNFAKKTFGVKNVLYRWSTQDYVTLDDIPYIGHLTSKFKNIYVATGFKKWGMTNSTASAAIIADMITNGKSEYEDVFNPSRYTPSSTGRLFTVNMSVAKDYIKGKMEPADIVNNESKIKKGEAEIVEKNGKKYGAYRDIDGKLYEVDITCTHMGCELSWNEAEKTWDCPCHGSRFKYNGEVVEGPAFIPLKNYGEGDNNKDANVF